MGGGGGGLIRKRGLIEKGAYSKSYLFDEIHSILPNLTKNRTGNWFCITILRMNCHLTITYRQFSEGNRLQVMIDS